MRQRALSGVRKCRHRPRVYAIRRVRSYLRDLTAKVLTAIVVIASLLMESGAMAGGPMEVIIEGRPDDNFSFAAFHCWLPTRRENIRGALCLVLHPHGSSAVAVKESKPWEALAEKYEAALITVAMVGSDSGDQRWDRAKEGSGRALLAAIDLFSERAGLSRLKDGPTVIAGVCQAGQFAHAFAGFAPDRVAGFVSIGGGLYDFEAAPEAVHVPGLLVAATDGGLSAYLNITDLFSRGRVQSAPWALSEEAISSYDKGECSSLVRGFIEAFLSVVSRGGDVETKEGVTIPLSSGVLYKPQIAPDRGSVATSAWFPNRELADLSKGGHTTSPQLSFVSQAIVIDVAVVPPILNLGDCHLGTDKRHSRSFSLDVRFPEVSSVGRVFVVKGAKSFITSSHKITNDHWRIICNLALDEFATGRFTVSIPIRFEDTMANFLGGISVQVSGTVIRDVFASPSFLDFGTLFPGQNTIVKIQLKSRNGLPVAVTGIEQERGGDVVASIVRTQGEYCFINFYVDPSLAQRKRQSADRYLNGMAGYLYIRAKADKEEQIKVLFTGRLSTETNPERKQ